MIQRSVSIPMRRHLIAACLLAILSLAPDDQPRLRVVPSISWSLDRVVDLTSAGTVTGTNVAFTDLDCSGFSNGGAVTADANGNFQCSADDTGTGGASNSFETLSVPAGTNPVADSSTDTLTITEDTFLTMTGTAATDTLAVTQVTTDLGTDGLIAANAVALTTDTTGNYVADVADGSGIDVTGTAAEGWTATVNLLYTDTLAGNPAMNADECRFSTDGTGGGILCEGAADTLEGLLVWNPGTADRTLTLPDATDTLVGRATTDTLTNKTIDATNTVTIDVTDITAAASSSWAGRVTDETGTGVWVFGTAPTFTGTITADGVTVGTDELLTMGSDTLEFDGTSADFELSDDLNLRDGTPHLQFVDTDASQDDWELDGSNNQFILWNQTDSASIFRVETTNELTITASGFRVPTGVNPTVNFIGEVAHDTNDDQLVYGSAPRVLAYERTVCGRIFNVASTDDNINLWMANDAVTITAVGCHCEGTCTTAANFALEDRAANSMTHVTPTCSTGASNSTFAAVSGAGGLVAGEGLRYDTTNTPNPDGSDEYILCFTYTVDRQ